VSRFWDWGSQIRDTPWWVGSGVAVLGLGVADSRHAVVGGQALERRGNRRWASDDREPVETNGTNRNGDPSGLSCGSARELVSAAADDSLGGDEAETLSMHLDGCAACTAYQARITDLSRSTRIRSASIDPDFVDAVMVRTQPARLGRGGWLRPALAWCGLVLAWQSLEPLLFGDLDGAPTHVARHVGASTMALAIGLLYVAWRPHRAAGLLPYAGALFLALSAGAVFDVMSGDRSAASELVHVVELVGMALLWMIAGSPGWDRIDRFVTRRGVAASTNP